MREMLLETEVALTPRERAIARLVAEGKQNKQIAHELGVTTPTIKAHLGAVYAKTRVRNRVELTLLMLETRDA
jgi:DNA-binding CsgD family transcriptional regulator